MDDSLIDDDRLPLSRKSVLPGAGFFVPDWVDDRREEARTAAAVSGAEAVVVADPDADGLGCVALVRAARGGDGSGATPGERDADSGGGDGGGGETGAGNAAVGPAAADAEGAVSVEPDALGDVGPDERAGGGGDGGGTSDDGTAGEGTPDDGTPEGAVPVEGAAEATAPRTPAGVALVPAGPHEFAEALARLADALEPGADVYVCDLCPDGEDDLAALEALVERAGAVRWFDHHQWDPGLRRAVEDAGVDLVVGESDEECSTDVALRSLEADFDERFAELAAVTRDHDLWIRDDPRSDDLADYAHWVDAEEYVAVVRDHGPDLPPAAMEYVEERRVEKEALVERAVDRATLHEVGPWTVAVTYGRCSQNEVAEALREAGADASVIVKPAGSASIRGTDAFERCHEVARQVGGGGHPKAAGCKPDVYDDMLDYAHHWTTEGAVARRLILGAFRTLPAEDDEGVETEQ